MSNLHPLITHIVNEFHLASIPCDIEAEDLATWKFECQDGDYDKFVDFITCVENELDIDCMDWQDSLPTLEQALEELYYETP